MNESSVTRFMERIWEDDILPTLTDYIRIPNKSPAFDPKWVEHGHMDKAVALNAWGSPLRLNAPWWFWNLFGEQAVFLLSRR